MNHSLIAPRRGSPRPPPLPREALAERIQALELTIAQLRAENAMLQAMPVTIASRPTNRNPDLAKDTILALQSLGIKKTDAERRVKATPINPNETVETILKVCLKPAR